MHTLTNHLNFNIEIITNFRLKLLALIQNLILHHGLISNLISTQVIKNFKTIKIETTLTLEYK